MSERTILVWFRNDLRIDDNEILLEATRKADKVLPVYLFDPFYFKITPSGTQKTGSFRAKFLIESVHNLRENLRAMGSDLLVRVGSPAEVIPALATEFGVNEVYHHREVAFEETAVSEQVEAALWKIKLNLKHFIGHTLYHKEDLPFPIKDIPDSFATFRKKIERDSNVRVIAASPEVINTPTIAEPGEIPTLQDLGLEEPADDPRDHFHFAGGETVAHQRLQQFFAGYDLALHSKVKNANSGSHLSPWLTFGCMSPRQVYWQSVKHGQKTDARLILELLWRDYFRFMFKKYGNQFFKADGFKDEAPKVSADQYALLEQWKSGNTGIPFIDASMHQLAATGYINNYCRQMVATYLVKEMQVDWTKGAAYFEEKLIDYSPASNWGNWAFIAGVGSDPRDNKYFIPAKPAAAHDPKDDFIQTWLPANGAELDAMAG
ncbi:DASH family cryptochrome [Mucilaginibacter myungsuensis]|uniref:Cryptochrome DASH n=1 Tax=Mucilaginibacter myungsuensis TaxID=649104 RepID=A0A929L0K3_9SPHI|nr:DASH family cryptochrome [Mucilaginibacter myungsuensis]MBE9664037.1 DASH family cryptochrome [Mucilaginibacter myungsuensis]MDN3601216.1 DASH family cryptochrome [Mucilaginibacter myungsuensis]